MFNIQRFGTIASAAGLSLVLFSTPTLAVEETTYIMLDDGSLRLSDGRTASTNDYHAMPDGSLMLNDGTPLFEPASSVSSETEQSPESDIQLVSIDHSSHNMSADTTPGASTGSHVHHHHGAGNFMFQYHFMHMNMKNLINQSTSLNASSTVLPGGDFQFMMAPTNMDMDMNMFMTMFGITERLTLMAMFNYQSNNMEMISNNSDYFSMKSEGMADTDISLVFNATSRLVTNLALSLPTGDINQRATMTMGGVTQQTTQPYAMQLGSGTYDLKPAINYSSGGKVSWGGQAQYTWRLGTNENNYTLGNRLDTDTWLKWAFNKHSNVSAKINWLNQGPIKGRNTDIATTMQMTNPSMPNMNMSMNTNPLADPANYGGNYINWALGFSGTSRNGGINFNMAVGAPLYQKVNGLQMKNRLMISSAINWMF